jgi:hypothetical protein
VWKNVTPATSLGGGNEGWSTTMAGWWILTTGSTVHQLTTLRLFVCLLGGVRGGGGGAEASFCEKKTLGLKCVCGLPKMWPFCQIVRCCVHARGYCTVCTATKIPFMHSFSGNCAASDPISTFMCLLCDLYKPRIGPGSNVGIYKKLTDTWMWKLGLWARNSFSRNMFFEFSVLALCIHLDARAQCPAC